jgi:hypothetical protein
MPCIAPGVDLPQVDVVGAQPLQRPGQITQQGAAGGVDDPLAVADHEAGLGRDHHVLAPGQLADQLADQPLGVAGAVRRGRVDQRAARFAERLQQTTRLLLGGVASPGEGAEPEP